MSRPAQVVLQAPVHQEPILSNPPMTLAPVKKMSLLEQLQMDLGIPEQSGLPEALYTAGRYRNLLSVYNDLPAEVTVNPKSVVFILRSYLVQKNWNATEKFLTDHLIDWWYNRGDQKKQLYLYSSGHKPIINSMKTPSGKPSLDFGSGQQCLLIIRMKNRVLAVPGQGRLLRMFFISEH